MNSTIGVIFDKLNLMGLYPIYKSINNSTVVYRDSTKAELLYEINEDTNDKYVIRQDGKILGDNMVDTQVIEFIRNDTELNGVPMKEEQTTWNILGKKKTFTRYVPEVSAAHKEATTRTPTAPEAPKTVSKKREISMDDLDEEE
jgi:hypothetical protein